MGGHHPPSNITVKDDDSVRLSPGLDSVRKFSMYIGFGGLGLAILLSFFVASGGSHFFHSYLLNFAFFLSISLGALFFVPIQHLSRAGWSVVVRRLAELISQNVILLAILFLPILLPVIFQSRVLYDWNQWNPSDELYLKKWPYLNWIFFTIRAFIYFGAWALIARFFFNRSREQDTSGDKKLTLTMQTYSSWAIVAFALTATFASFDWLMSLDAHWFSTMFGVYFFAGCNVSFFAVLTLFVYLLQQNGKLTNVVNQEHYHDLGKYLWGFNLFWGYIAFSQFLLIWYANIPEETAWYLRRQENGWEYIAICLVIGHFFIPFFGIMSRKMRRNKHVLASMSVWMLLMHWIDLYYIIMPEFSAAYPAFGLIDVCSFVGIGGLSVSMLIWFALDKPLVPVKDPRLPESLALKNL